MVPFVTAGADERTDATADHLPAAPGRGPDGAVQTPAVEREVVVDMVRRGLPLCAALLLGCTLAWRGEGAVSSAIAIALVIANFAVSAAVLGWTARISPSALMAGALGGFLVRLGLVAVVLTLLADQPWVSLPALSVSLLASHLGLLLWELRYVSAGLAYPGVRPR